MAKRKKIIAPTVAEVAAEIEKLREMMPYIRQTTGFGDDNHEAIDAQICVLKERMGNDDIYDRYQPQNDDGTPDESGNDSHMLNNALEALQWLEGETAEKPSDGWKSLDRRSRIGGGTNG